MALTPVRPSRVPASIRPSPAQSTLPAQEPSTRLGHRHPATAEPGSGPGPARVPLARETASPHPASEPAFLCPRSPPGRLRPTRPGRLVRGALPAPAEDLCRRGRGPVARGAVPQCSLCPSGRHWAGAAEGVTRDTSLALPPRPRCPQPPCGHGATWEGLERGRRLHTCGILRAHGRWRANRRLGAQCSSCSVTGRTPLTSGVSPPAPPHPLLGLGALRGPAPSP